MTSGLLELGDGTRMVDRLDFAAPLGVLGRVAERLFLTAYMRRFLTRRAVELRRMAEDASSGLPEASV